jgi:hypothetical protein
MAAWAGLGYYARARNLIACARAVAASMAGAFRTGGGAAKLPGIGRYTAAAIAAIAFGRRAVVVDGNVERVVARLFAVEEPLPARGRGSTRWPTAITPDERAGDFAQAMMDLGATICTPRAPRCGAARSPPCCAARAEGRPEAYPVKAPRRPSRSGRAPPIGWSMTARAARPPAGQGAARRHAGAADRQLEPPARRGAPCARVAGGGRASSHVFTHFALTPAPALRRGGGGGAKASGGRWTGSRRRACRPCSPRRRAGAAAALRRESGMIGFTGSPASTAPTICGSTREDRRLAASPRGAAAPPGRLDPVLDEDGAARLGPSWTADEELIFLGLDGDAPLVRAAGADGRPGSAPGACSGCSNDDGCGARMRRSGARRAA